MALAALPVLIGGVALLGPSAPADASPEIVTSSVLSSAGELFTATNHLVDLPGIASPGADGHRPKEYLVVWAGDANASDIIGADIKNAPLQVSPGKELSEVSDQLPGPDFLAVIDADCGSPHYGKVVNTVTLGPVVGMSRTTCSTSTPRATRSTLAGSTPTSPMCSTRASSRSSSCPG